MHVACPSSACCSCWPRPHRSSRRISTVTPDAASTFVGGAVLYLATRWEAGGRWRWLALIGIGFVGTAIKIQDSIIVMMIVLYFLFRMGAPAASGTRGAVGLAAPDTAAWPVRLVRSAQVRAVGIILITTVVIASTWTVLQRATETIDPNKLLVNQQFVVSSISLQQIASTFGVFLAPVPGAYIPAAMQNVWTIDMSNVLSWLLIAGVVGAALFRARTQAIASLARATLLLALAGWAHLRRPELSLHEPVHPDADPVRLHPAPRHGGVHGRRHPGPVGRARGPRGRAPQRRGRGAQDGLSSLTHPAATSLACAGLANPGRAQGPRATSR